MTPFERKIIHDAIAEIDGCPRIRPGSSPGGGWWSSPGRERWPVSHGMSPRGWWGWDRGARAGAASPLDNDSSVIRGCFT